LFLRLKGSAESERLLMETREIKALISLLDDTDKDVYSHIHHQLVLIGKKAIPLLEDAWSQSMDVLMQQRIEDIVSKIQFDSLKRELALWSHSRYFNLMEGVILIARFQYPDLDENKIYQQLNQLQREIWLELNDNLTSFEKVHVINRILFEMHSFGGNTTNFHAPQNSFINNVLESRKGNPLLLSVIYAHIARQLDMPVYGVNLPEHFILAFMNHSFNGDFEKATEEEVMFYINPFSKGSVFDKKEIDNFLKKLSLVPQPSYYIPCSNIEIMKRLLRNLIYSYEKLDNEEKSEQVKQLMKVITVESES
jgi:regulator of sirC expression with transglutaminase-like and TPR domain